MPFDPKLIHADEPPLSSNGDLILPPDFAALAGQLTADACHLAACYPPPLTRSVSEEISTLARSASEGPHRRTTALIASATAASLAALLAGFVAFWHGTESNPQTHSSTPSAPTHYVTTAAPSDTAISLTELSSPELEAFLDLVEGSPENTIRVSF